mgnify:CR=1 FL=1
MIYKEIREIEEAKEKYIEDLLRKWCDKYEKGKNYGVEGMKELLQRSQKAGHSIPILKKQLPRQIQWGINRWWRYSTGVIDRQKDDSGQVSYQIRNEFYQAVEQILSKHSRQS